MTPKQATIQADITLCLFEAVSKSGLQPRTKRAFLHKLAEGRITLQTVSEIVQATGKQLVFRLEEQNGAGPLLPYNNEVK